MHVYVFACISKTILKRLNESLTEIPVGAVGEKDSGNRADGKQRKGEVYTFICT